MLLPHLLLSVMQLQVLFDVFCWNIWSPCDTSGSWSASAAADLLADTSVYFWLSVSMLLILDLLRCPRSLLALILIHLTLSWERRSSKKWKRTASAFDIAYIMPMFIWGCSSSFSFRLVIKCWWVSVTDRLQSPWNHVKQMEGWIVCSISCKVILKRINMTTDHQHRPLPGVCSLPGAPLHINNCMRLEKLKRWQHLVFLGGLPSKH